MIYMGLLEESKKRRRLERGEGGRTTANAAEGSQSEGTPAAVWGSFWSKTEAKSRRREGATGSRIVTMDNTREGCTPGKKGGMSKGGAS